MCLYACVCVCVYYYFRVGDENNNAQKLISKEFRIKNNGFYVTTY